MTTPSGEATANRSAVTFRERWLGFLRPDRVSEPGWANLWRWAVAVSLITSSVRSGRLAAELPLENAAWYALQFGPLALATLANVRSGRVGAAPRWPARPPRTAGAVRCGLDLLRSRPPSGRPAGGPVRGCHGLPAQHLPAALVRRAHPGPRLPLHLLGPRRHPSRGAGRLRGRRRSVRRRLRALPRAHVQRELRRHDRRAGADSGGLQQTCHRRAGRPSAGRWPCGSPVRAALSSAWRSPWWWSRCNGAGSRGRGSLARGPTRHVALTRWWLGVRRRFSPAGVSRGAPARPP